MFGNGAEDYSWSLFAGSGNLGYYMLFRSLENDRIAEEREIWEKTR